MRAQIIKPYSSILISLKKPESEQQSIQPCINKPFGVTISEVYAVGLSMSATWYSGECKPLRAAIN